MVEASDITVLQPEWAHDAALNKDDCASIHDALTGAALRFLASAIRALPKPETHHSVFLCLNDATATSSRYGSPSCALSKWTISIARWLR